jgi:hypothetical protein
MSDLYTDAEKAVVAANLLHLHDTFGRDIIVYKEAQKVIISTDPNYNYLYNSGGSTTTSVTNKPVKKTFKARIRYDLDNKNLESNIGSNETSQVRIKLKKEDYTYISDAKRIELDGRMFHVDSDPRAHGLFDVQFYTLFLRSVE